MRWPPTLRLASPCTTAQRQAVATWTQYGIVKTTCSEEQRLALSLAGTLRQFLRTSKLAHFAGMTLHTALAAGRLGQRGPDTASRTWTLLLWIAEAPPKRRPANRHPNTTPWLVLDENLSLPIDTAALRPWYRVDDCRYR